MTNAVILSAGQGKRLSPLTDARPKCLIEVGGRPILHWQLIGLAANDVREATIVTGFRDDLVREALADVPADIEARALFNPFYQVADNIGSCWLARERINEDTVLLNGDTLFEPAVLTRLLADARAPITVTMDVKDHYDADDMKVRVEDGRLTDIGKTLTGRIDGESIGMLRFLHDGGRRFEARLRHVLADPAALDRWYLSIIHELAQEGGVGVARLRGERWCEMDYPADVPIAEALARSWTARSPQAAAGAV